MYGAKLKFVKFFYQTNDWFVVNTKVPGCHCPSFIIIVGMSVFSLVAPSAGRQDSERNLPDTIKFVQMLVKSPSSIRPVLQSEHEK